MRSKQFKALFTSRAFRVGLYSAFSSMIVIAIAIGVILFVDTLPATYTKFDITKNQIYTISEQTEQILESVDQDVTIYLLAQNGKEDATILKMLERYEALNDRIRVTIKDPVLYPNFAQEYTDEQVYENSLIVVSENRSKFVSYYDIYLSTIDYNTYQRVTELNGEGSITSAINYVTSDKIPKIYLLTGHGERTMSPTLTSAISKENIETESLSLLTTDTVPEDADCLFIYGPSSDLSAEESEKILLYLEDGGTLMLITDYMEIDMPNLTAVTENYGVATAEGIILEGDPKYCISQYNFYLLPKINSHTITAPLTEGSYYVLMPYAEGLVELDDVRSSVSIEQLLTTSDKAYAKPNATTMTTTEKEEGDTDGPFSLGVAISEAVGGGETKVVWFTTSGLLDDSANQTVAGGNFDLFINSLNWMCEREDNIYIRTKSLSGEYLVVPAGASSGWSILLVGVLPLGFLTVGVAVWIKRRRK